MFAAVLVLFLLPWLDKHKVEVQRSDLLQTILLVVFINCIVLGWVGAMPAEGVYVLIARIASVYYFSFFLIIMLYFLVMKISELPSSISAAVLSKKFDKDVMKVCKVN